MPAPRPRGHGPMILADFGPDRARLEGAAEMHRTGAHLGCAAASARPPRSPAALFSLPKAPSLGRRTRESRPKLGSPALPVLQVVVPARDEHIKCNSSLRSPVLVRAPLVTYSGRVA